MKRKLHTDQCYASNNNDIDDDNSIFPFLPHNV